MTKLITIFLALIYCLPAYSKPKEEYFDVPKVVAVQNRDYYLADDLTVQLGLLPSDAFNKGLFFGLTYSYYFKDYFAWEVVNLNYNINYETALKSDFQDLNIDIENTGFDGALDYMTYFATTSLVYTPLYTKSLLFNDTVVKGETSFVGGLGAANFKENGLLILASFGLYLRFFTKDNRSWKFDFRNNIYFEETLGAVNAWSFTVGYSFQLGEPPKNLGVRE